MKIPKFLQSATSKLKNVDICSERNFRRDWRLVIVTGFTIILLVLAAVWYYSAAVTSDSTTVKAGSREVLTINRSAMDEIVNFYKDQDRLFKEVKSTAVSVSDPSR